MPRDAHPEARPLSIVFADVSGSSQLYESLGDVLARQLVTDSLSLMGNCADAHDGTVVETIGDELFCTFDSPDQAVSAAVAMQEAIETHAHNEQASGAQRLGIHVGLHHALAVSEGDSVYGDAVNVAAHMRGLAKRGQVLMTRETVDALSVIHRDRTRHIHQTTVKGRVNAVDVYEVVWQSDATQVAPRGTRITRTSAQLRLTYGGADYMVDDTNQRMVLGRGEDADLVIDDSMASREHARIEYRNSGFALIDMSTNGTYVFTPNATHFVHREEFMLRRAGKIALGRNESDAAGAVAFVCIGAGPQ
ncbi:MAG: adenylate/guanylate cyclase domain-containing protein [Gammaproteobacteria bacterium]